MPKMASDAAMTIPTPPRGNRTASGAPISTKMMHANGIANFLWISTWYWLMRSWMVFALFAMRCASSALGSERAVRAYQDRFRAAHRGHVPVHAAVRRQAEAARVCDAVRVEDDHVRAGAQALPGRVQGG